MTVVYSKRLEAATLTQKLANWLLYELSQETLKGDFVCQKSNLNTTKISRNEKLTHHKYKSITQTLQPSQRRS